MFAEREKPAKEQKSESAIAQEFGVPQSTLSDHVKKGSTIKTQKEYLQSCQKLSPDQENTLVKLIQNCDERGLPLDNTDICCYATDIINRGKCKGRIELGKHWIQNFLDRN